MSAGSAGRRHRAPGWLRQRRASARGPSRASAFQAGVRGAAQNHAKQMIVLGIDPGLANTGYGVVRSRGGRLVALDGGVIETARRAAGGAAAGRHPRGDRWRCCASTTPTRWRSSSCTSARTCKTAFAVGQARGVAMLARGTARECHAASYTPQQVKGAVCGNGPRREGAGRADGAGAAGPPGAAPRPTTPPTRWRSRSATPTARRCRERLRGQG